MTTEYRPPAGWLYSTRRIYTEGAENENREETLKTLVVDDQRVFVSDTDGPEEYAGFFEDDGDTGYLYVSDRREKNIVQHLQIYVNSPDLSVNESDVEVVWSTDRTRCGVRIWGALRGVIDVRSGTQARAFVTSRDSDPIHAAEWLAGFDQRPQTEGAEAEGGEEAVTSFSPDDKVRAIRPLTEALFRHVLYDEKPIFISDEATMLDVSMADPGELQRRCSSYYGTAVTLDDLRKPLWRLLPELEQSRRGLRKE